MELEGSVALPLSVCWSLVLELRGGAVYAGVRGPRRTLCAKRLNAEFDVRRIEARTEMRPGLVLRLLLRNRLAVYDCGHLRGHTSPEALLVATASLRSRIHDGGLRGA